MKIFNSKRSAIKALRRIGVRRRDYEKFLVENDDGTIECYLEEAEDYVYNVHRKNPGGIGDFCRTMILDGYTNDEILAKMVEVYGEDYITTRYKYPAWYRAELRRKGLLPPAFDYPAHQRTGTQAIRIFED